MTATPVRRAGLPIAIFGFLLFWVAGASAACLDGNPKVAEEFAKTPIVMVGTAIESHDVPDDNDDGMSSYTIYIVKAREVIKGKPAKRLWLFSVNTSSRFPMDLNVPYLLFVQHSPDMDFVDSCGNSAPLKEAKDVYEETKRIAAGAAKKDGR